MTETARAVLEQALRLDPVERAELIDRLFESFDPQPDPRIEAAWAEEAERRIDAFDAGKISADSAEAVFKRIAKR